MKFLDLFAGIGGFRLGMESAGHECIGFCEIDKFTRASYKAIHNTKGEIELHDITTVSDDTIKVAGLMARLSKKSIMENKDAKFCRRNN
ncbi:type II DNA modification methyltransferase [Streptococcus pneumoniae]|nr:type II DNA modification methyltransferase [Streptococcus pneumoniae]VRH66530.1 type II DNA modification methyltransferase [Streptococcus pneumoniae]